MFAPMPDLLALKLQPFALVSDLLALKPQPFALKLHLPALKFLLLLILKNI